MKYPFLIILLLSSSLIVTAQMPSFQATEVASMPERVSNNAVTEGFVNGQPFVYSFAGIDSTKTHSGIHLKSYRYDVMNDIWSILPPLPDTLGKIAAGASTVKNKIYIVGGYHVYANGNEKSSDKIHIFDPEINSYLPDGSPIPVPIDDHVQAVWRDSLIFVVTGWSDNANVDDVQIYNPSNDTWSAGTPVTNNINHRVFGASGMIIGDTIYYIGGARFAANFPPTVYIRKGYIDPTNPTNITWSVAPDGLSRGYRMAAVEMFGYGMWFGGSKTTYNYDGIAYNGTGGVSPEDRVVFYNPTDGSLNEDVGNIPAIMDLRGIAKISTNGAIIAGGMIGNQEVTNKTYKLFSLVLNTKKTETLPLSFYPNPTSNYFKINGINQGKVSIFNTLGQLVLFIPFANNESISVNHLPKGIYEIIVESEEKKYTGKIMIE